LFVCFFLEEFEIKTKTKKYIYLVFAINSGVCRRSRRILLRLRRLRQLKQKMLLLLSKTHISEFLKNKLLLVFFAPNLLTNFRKVLRIRILSKKKQKKIKIANWLNSARESTTLFPTTTQK
jgi:hypothetical protein